jgi:hypothetical protein
MKLSFSAVKGKGKYPHVTKFVSEELPKLKGDGSVLKAFTAATGTPSSKLETGLRWTMGPVLQIMPASAGDFVGYLGDDKLLLSQDWADRYEDDEEGLLGKGGCLCQQTSRGLPNWAVLEIEIVRSLALWGCPSSTPPDDREQRSQQFIDAVFGTSRPNKDYRNQK